MKLHVTRDVTPAECPWLERTVTKGEPVYRFDGCTYGCISDGIAVTYQDGKTPFFELPNDALSETI